MPNCTKLALLGAATMIALTLPFAANAQQVVITPGRNGVDHMHTAHPHTNRTNRNNTKRTAARSGTAAKKHKIDLTEALGQINLTPAQRTQIDGYQSQSEKAGRDIYNDKALTGQQVVDKMDTTNRTMISNIVATLTPEQKTKLGQLYPEAKGF